MTFLLPPGIKGLTFINVSVLALNKFCNANNIEIISGGLLLNHVQFKISLALLLLLIRKSSAVCNCPVFFSASVGSSNQIVCFTLILFSTVIPPKREK